MKLPGFIPTETLKMAFDNVRAHKFRSFLTVLGIVIGVLTVIVVASILTGMRQNVIAFVEDYGTNNVFAFHLSTGPQLGPRDRREFSRKPLTAEDGMAIRDQASAVDDVAWSVYAWRMDRTISYNGVTYRQGNLQGVSANYAMVTTVPLQEGRFISDLDDKRRRDVIVIGINVAEALFPNRSNVAGAQVLLGGRQFEVIGVTEKRRGGFFGENEQDNAVFMPFRTVRKLSPRSNYVMVITKARPGQLRAAMGQIEDVLRRQRGLKFDEANNFDLSTADRFIEQFDSITAKIGLVVIAISSIGLLVGGIGVMNIMLVSVTERTHEIGIRKAIGAKRHDIVSQFLFEAMTLTFFGGVLGVLLAIGVSRIIVLLLPSLPATIPAWAVVTGLFVSIAIGLVFGVWPARKAARLDPIEALRYE